MNRRVNKYISNVVKIFLNMIIAVYLVGVLGINIIEQPSEYYFFVGCYFLLFYIITTHILKVSNRITYKNKRRIFIIAIIFTGITLLGVPQVINKVGQTVNISISSIEINEDKLINHEVWLTQIKVDDKILDLSKIERPLEWEYRDGMLLTTQINSPLELRLNLKEKVEISFLEHPWSGVVQVDYNDKSTQEVLYNQGSGSYTYTNIEKANYSVENILQYMCSYIAIIGITYLVLLTLYKNSKVIIFIYVYIGILAFGLSNKIYTDSITKVIIILVSALVGYLFVTKKDEVIKIVPVTKIQKILFICITAYSTFAIVGSELIFTKGYFKLDISNLCMIILFVIWIIPLQLTFVFLLSKWGNKLTCPKQIGEKKGIWINIFLLSVAILVTYYIAYWPANMSFDSINQWGQAIGSMNLTDSHPITHTLLIKFLLSIYNSPAIVAAAQIILFSLTIASIFNFFFKKGLNKMVIYICTILLSLVPTNGINLMTIWKDIPYSILLVILTYGIMKLVENKFDIFINKSTSIIIFLSAILIPLFRHNGIIVIILLSISLIIYGIISHKYSLIIFSIIIVLGFNITEQAIYKQVNIEKELVGGLYNPYVNDLIGLKIDNKDIAEETETFLYDLLPKELWEELYNPYTTNQYVFSTNGLYEANSKNKTMQDLVPLYIENLIKHPIDLIYNRLCGSEILWNVKQANGSYNYRFCTGIIENKYGLESKTNTFTKLYNKILDISYKYTFIDIFLWRAGIYIILLLLIAYYLVISKQQHKLWVFIPGLGNALSLFATLGWQDYRYVYFVFINFCIIFMYTLIKPSIDKNLEP